MVSTAPSHAEGLPVLRACPSARHPPCEFRFISTIFSVVPKRGILRHAQYVCPKGVHTFTTIKGNISKQEKKNKNQSKQTNKNNQARATVQFLTNAIPNTPVLDIYLFAKGTRFKSVAALSGTFL